MGGGGGGEQEFFWDGGWKNIQTYFPLHIGKG